MSLSFKGKYVSGFVVFLMAVGAGFKPAQSELATNLFTCQSVDGKIKQHFEKMTSDFSWSPGGAEVVFGRGYEDRQQLRVLNLATGGHICLTSGEYTDHQPSWSPDGKTIAFASDRSGKMQIHILELASGRISLLRESDRLQNYPVYSPDGSQIAYVQNDGEAEDGVRTLRLMNTDGSGDRMLHRSLFGLNNHSWSMDGSEIFFYSIEHGRYNDILVANVHDGSVRELTNHTVTESYSMVQSPDGGAVSFSQGMEKSAYSRWFNYEMMVRESPDARVKRLTYSWTPDDRQQYSPDGRTIVFTSRRTGYAELFQMDADGTNLRRLTRQPESELTRIFFEKGAAAARQAFEAAREKDKSVLLFNERAPEIVVNILVARGHLDAAEEMAEMFLASYPDSARAFRTRAFVRLKKNMPEAMDDYQAAVVREPNEMGAFLQLGQIRFFEMVSEVPDFWLDRAEGMNSLAYRLIGLGDPRSAVAIFNKLVETDPENWAKLDSLAEAFMLYGDYDSAVHFYGESLRRNPDNDNAIFHLSRIKGLATKGGARP